MGMKPRPTQREIVRVLAKIVAEIPPESCHCYGGSPCVVHGEATELLKRLGESIPEFEFDPFKTRKLPAGCDGCYCSEHPDGDCHCPCPHHERELWTRVYGAPPTPARLEDYRAGR